METMSQLEIAQKLNYITSEDLSEAEKQVSEIAKSLTNLQYSYLPKADDGQLTYKPINS